VCIVKKLQGEKKKNRRNNKIKNGVRCRRKSRNVGEWKQIQTPFGEKWEFAHDVHQTRRLPKQTNVGGTKGGS